MMWSLKFSLQHIRTRSIRPNLVILCMFISLAAIVNTRDIHKDVSYRNAESCDTHSGGNHCLKNENSLKEQNYCARKDVFLLKTRAKGKPSRYSDDYDDQYKSCVERSLPYNVTKKTLSDLIEEHLIRTNYMDAFDLREKSTLCPSISEITDQGSCDSCWAVAATDVMTDRLCIKSNGTNKARYSTVDLLSCCKNCQNTAHEGSCTGGGIHSKAWLYWVKTGIVTGHYNSNGEIGCRNYKIPPCRQAAKHEQEQIKKDLEKSEKPKCRVQSMHCPNVEIEPTCDEENQECDDSYNQRTYKEDRMKGKECYSFKRQFDGNETVIKLEIVMHGPVHAFMTVYESFYSFSEAANDVNEVEPYFVPQETEDKPCRGHSIRIVGWGKKGVKSYWIAANSWGEKWGSMNGFFHLDFNHDMDVRKGKEIVYAGIPQLNYT